MGTCGTVELVGTFDKSVALVGTFDKDVALAGIFDKNQAIVGTFDKDVAVAGTFDKDIALVGCSSHLASSWWRVAGAGSYCVGAYQAKGAASQAAAKVNLANPGTYDLTGTDPPWSATRGFQIPSATGTAYYDTGVMALPGWTIICQFGNLTGSGIPVWGNYRPPAGGQYGMELYPSTGTQRAYTYGTRQAAAAPPVTAGNMGMAGRQGYLNGAADLLVASTTWSNADTVRVATIYLVGQWWTLGVDWYAGAIYNRTLTTAQMAAIAAAMAQL